MIRVNVWRETLRFARVPNLNLGTDVPLYFAAYGRVTKPPALRVVV
jgi:hypothetical protein